MGNLRRAWGRGGLSGTSSLGSPLRILALGSDLGQLCGNPRDAQPWSLGE